MSTEEISLEELAEDLHPQEIRYIQIFQQNKRIKDVQLKLEDIVDPPAELVSQYTAHQYVTQEVEITEGLRCTFRTLSPFAVDESMKFAQENSDPDTYSRVLGRRRLAYSLMAINDEYVGGATPVASWNLPGKELKEELTENANKRYAALEFIGLSDKISEAFGVWEQVVYNRVNGIEDLGETIKNSTRISEVEQ